jgi:hypothetical protein
MVGLEPLPIARLLTGRVICYFERFFNSYAAADSRIPLSASDATSTNLA